MTSGADQPDPARPDPAQTDPVPAGPGVFRLLRHEYVTPEAIYGTVLITVIIDTQEPEHTAYTALVIATLTAFVFWLAHVFAHTVARHGVKRGRDIPLATAIREAILHSTGFLTGPLIPLAVLALGPLGVVDDSTAFGLSELVSIAILFALGALALAERGRRWYACLLGGLLTAGVGVLVIALELILH
jgi:hypothetical protein